MIPASWFNAITWLVLALFAAASLVVLLYDSSQGERLRPIVRRALRAVSGRADTDWLDWRPVTVALLVGFGCVSVYALWSGQYTCRANFVNDPVGLLGSGQALWHGTDPFNVANCGGTQVVPYGMAAVLLDALGSLGGLPGIFLVWGLLAFTIVPLAWAVAGPERQRVILFLGTSVLCFPVISSQIDGTTNAIVPVTVLLSLYLAQRGEPLAAVVGGVLSTARFPNLFPLLASTGGLRRRRVLTFLLTAASFGAVTAVSYVLWGDGFLNVVLLGELSRRSFSLNLYGVFLLTNTLPSSTGIEVGEAVLTLALVLGSFLFVRSALRGAALTLCGVALLTPFLSYTIMIWLLPVALCGSRARWWLWGIGLVGALNYDLALSVWAWEDGVVWPSALLDVVLTVLLVGLFYELCRAEIAAASPDAAAEAHPGGGGSLSEAAGASGAGAGRPAA